MNLMISKQPPLNHHAAGVRWRNDRWVDERLRFAGDDGYAAGADMRVVVVGRDGTGRVDLIPVHRR